MSRSLTRREFLKAASAGIVGSALLGSTACSSPASPQRASANQRVTLNLWYWNRSIDDKILAQVDQQFPNVHLVPQKIGGDFKAKLLVSLAGHAYVPDITGINADISTYFPDKDQFYNLYDFGAHKVQREYLKWKWDEGVTPGGYMIGYPMDTGPTALFYRYDLLEKAGLPSDPDEVARAMPTWEAYFEAGRKFQAAMPHVHWLDDITTVFTQIMAQSPKQYMDKEGRFIGDGEHVKRAWDLSVRAHQMDLSGNVAGFTTDWNAAMDNGSIATFVGAVWMKLILEQAAPDTKGKWHVCRAPGGAGNNGGSFLAVTKYSKHPKEAFEVIRWVQSPPHQLQAYVEIDLYPSAPSVYSSPKMNHPEAFYGGQNTNLVFSTSARNVRPGYFGPGYDIINPIYGQYLTNVETQGANPEAAWHATLDEIKRQLSHQGMYKK